MASSQKTNRVNLEPTDSCGVGCVASIENRQSSHVLNRGLIALANVAHRGAIGADGKTGDGCGVMTDLPNDLVQRWLEELEVYHDTPLLGVGCAFVPQDDSKFRAAQKLIQSTIDSLGMKFVAVRNVPINTQYLGAEAANRLPRIIQFFVTATTEDAAELERRLFIARRYIELSPQFAELKGMHIASLSCQKIVYKGMVLSGLLPKFYPDLLDPEYRCSVCVYHQRFSTNTSPDWERCQPFRTLAHNGEINTIRGNRNWMTSRETSFEHVFWNEHRQVISRLFNFNDSDSASLDNCVELLNLSGRSLGHTIGMMIPAAWESDPRISDAQKSFYEYHSCFCEPWDGPAAVVAFDGSQVIASLDRNGLRPLRYKITKDKHLIVGSEAGADRDPLENVDESGRLGPGQSLVVDLVEKRIIFNKELKEQIAHQRPYREWLQSNRIAFAADTDEIQPPPTTDSLAFFRCQIAAGMTKEEIQLGIQRMAENAVEATFSMGVDTPLAVLSQQPRNLADYFKQRFAQVTNPPIDPIRERLSMSLAAGLGPERNILNESEQHCRIFALENPVLLPSEFERLKSEIPFPFVELDCTFELSAGVNGLEMAIDQLIADACLAVESQNVVIILSDRSVNQSRIAIPMLLAVGAVHHGLQKNGQRMMASIVAETSDVRDAHQLSLLFGYGCTAVYPWLAFGSIQQLIDEKKIVDLDFSQCCRNYRDALCKGVLKVMSKMGISVLNSYQGAQIFEAIGIGPTVINKCFKYSYNNLDGIGFRDIAADCILRHKFAFENEEKDLKFFEPGIVKPKRAGEHHVINGKVTKNIHRFVNNKEPSVYADFVDSLTNERPVSVRDLFDLRLASQPTPIDEVEPIESIRKRFTTAAMSLGAISPEAHEAIAIAMNEIGGKSNSGEGGEDPARFVLNEDGTSANSKIKQVASGRFGVNARYLASAEEIEIKMAQGAKPGEGGQLPGFKVNDLIARLRNTSPGVTLISPPPHHDIYSIEDLAQLIFDLKLVNPRARICVKLVAKSGVGGIAVGVVKSFADVVLISGHEGGTGASPLTSIKHAGLPWEIGLAETHQSLVAANLRDRVILRADGGIRTGLDIIKAAIFGAEEYNFGTMALIALGCVYVKKCHLNNCPVGIATQDPKYRAKFRGQPENLVNYLNAVADECRPILAAMGARTIDEIVGCVDLMKPREFDSPKIQKLCTDAIISPSTNISDLASTQSKYQSPVQPQTCFDDRVIQQLPDSIDGFQFESEINNVDRNIGTRLSGEIAQRLNSDLSDDRIILRLSGTAGQSLGAFLCSGITLDIRGEANDYVGKGMSGGKILISRIDQVSTSESVVAGNAILYGATGGEFFAAGSVAERFCVRNSGANSVIEGCGDHGCEYMTRGTTIILGSVGNNFGAGMTGGKAFVMQSRSDVEGLINSDSVEVKLPSDEHLGWIKSQIVRLIGYTNSVKAKSILSNWETAKDKFLLIKPISKPTGLRNNLAASHKKLAAK